MDEQPGNISIASAPGELSTYRPPTADEVAMLTAIQTTITTTPTINDQLFGLYSSLSSASQILYAPYVATIKLLIDEGALALAKTIISGITVAPEDTNTQQQMVSLLGG